MFFETMDLLLTSPLHPHRQLDKNICKQHPTQVCHMPNHSDLTSPALWMVSPLSMAELSNILNILSNTSISAWIISLLHCNAFEDHPLTQNLVQYLPDILDAFHTSPIKLNDGLMVLWWQSTPKTSGTLHINIVDGTLEPWQCPRTQNMVWLAPDLWELIGDLFGEEQDADAPLETGFSSPVLWEFGHSVLQEYLKKWLQFVCSLGRITRGYRMLRFAWASGCNWNYICIMF